MCQCECDESVVGRITLVKLGVIKYVTGITSCLRSANISKVAVIQLLRGIPNSAIEG